MASRQYYAARGGSPAIAAWLGTWRAVPRFNDNQFITAMTLAAVQGADLEPAASTGSLSAVRRHVLSRLAPPAAAGACATCFKRPRRVSGCFRWMARRGSGRSRRCSAGTRTDRWIRTFPPAETGAERRELLHHLRLLGGAIPGRHPGPVACRNPGGGRPVVRAAAVREWCWSLSGGHFTRGARDHTSLSWSYEDRVLVSEFQGAPGKPYTLTVLIPGLRLCGAEFRTGGGGTRGFRGGVDLHRAARRRWPRGLAGEMRRQRNCIYTSTVTLASNGMSRGSRIAAPSRWSVGEPH